MSKQCKQQTDSRMRLRLGLRRRCSRDEAGTGRREEERGERRHCCSCCSKQTDETAACKQGGARRRRRLQLKLGLSSPGHMHHACSQQMLLSGSHRRRYRQQQQQLQLGGQSLSLELHLLHCSDVEATGGSSVSVSALFMCSLAPAAVVVAADAAGAAAAAATIAADCKSICKWKWQP